MRWLRRPRHPRSGSQIRRGVVGASALGLLALLAFFLGGGLELFESEDVDASRLPASATGTALAPLTPSPPGFVIPAGSPGCDQIVAQTLGQVGLDVYRNDLTGEGAQIAARQVTSSRPLAAAVAAEDPVAARSALAGLLGGRIVRVRIFGGSRLLAQVGQEPSIGPVGGTIRDDRGAAVGRFVLSVQGSRGYYLLMRSLARVRVVLSRGARRPKGPVVRASSLPEHGPIQLGGKTFYVVSYPIRALSGPIRVSILVPHTPAPGLCNRDPAQTVANTIGHIAMNIYRGELSSGAVRAAARLIDRTPALARAAAANDPQAVRTTVVGRLFASRHHIVRVRVDRAGQLVNDTGGPFALAPVRRPLRLDGRVVGQYVFSIQDDLGFVKLVKRYTGSDVLMRTQTGQVMGSLVPGPISVPPRGAVNYLGRGYHAFSFTAQRFPSGPLRISILVGV